MHRYILYLVILLSAQTVLGQTAATLAVDNTIVNYSFSTKKMDVLPFDRPFTFHLTDLPTTSPAFTFIRVKILKIKIKKNKMSSGTISEDDPANVGLTYVLKDWPRPDVTPAVTTADIPEPFLLDPNSAYQVSFELGSVKPLTDAEKTDLGTKLKNDNKLDGVVNELAKQSIASNFSDPSTFLATYKLDLISKLKLSVQSVNPAYNLNITDFLPPMADFRDALSNFVHHLDVLNVPDTHADGAKFNLVKKDLAAADFYTIDKTSTLQKDLSDYIASFPTTDQSTTLNNAKNLNRKLTDITTKRDALIQDLIKSVILPNVYADNPLGTTYSPDFASNAKFYINLDLGYAYVWRIDRGLAYSGFNFYFRPIDKTIPLSYYSGWDAIATRTSLLLGISFASVEKANVRKGLIGTQALILGGGFKLNPFLKLNGGVFMNYRYDTDPLVTQNTYHFSMSPFVSLSFDLDVKPLLSGLGDSIFK